MCVSNQLILALPSHFEVYTHRLVAKTADVGRHLQQIIQLRGMVKVALEMHAGQPDIQFVKHNAVGQSHRAEEFSLRKLKEMNISPVENNACRIDITPAYTLLNSEFSEFRHWGHFRFSISDCRLPIRQSFEVASAIRITLKPIRIKGGVQTSNRQSAID